MKRQCNQENGNKVNEQSFLFSKNNETRLIKPSDCDKFVRGVIEAQQFNNSDLVYPSPIRPSPKYQNSFNSSSSSSSSSPATSPYANTGSNSGNNVSVGRYGQCFSQQSEQLFNSYSLGQANSHTHHPHHHNHHQNHHKLQYIYMDNFLSQFNVFFMF